MSKETDSEKTGGVLWHFVLFGKLRAVSDRGVLEKFPTQKTGALLALLAFRRGGRVTREEAIDILWPDAELAAGRDRLSQALVWLRRELEFDDTARGSVLIADRLSLALESTAITTDVAAFEQSLLLAQRAPAPLARIEAIENAASLYAGDFLAGQYDDWVLTERRRLTESYVGALAELIAFYEERGELERALSAAQRAVLADQVREESHAHVIRLLHRSGQPAAALRQFDELKRILSKHLDTEPSTQMLETVANIRNAKLASPIRTIAAIPESRALPSPLTHFFGRESDVDDVCRQLVSPAVRLLSLTGAGGSGKTRLALAAGTRLRQTGQMNVAFVPVADLSDVSLVLPAVAAALNLRDAGATGRPPIEQIADAMAEKRFLLILDNLEHVVDSVAPIVRDLLERVPGLTILATSRQRLGIAGEREAPVPPLPVPAAEAPLPEVLESASVQLFLDRASAVRPGFTVSAGNASTIAHLCARLEGIPLAIELCAAWAQTLTPQQMLEKLDRRFELLVSRRMDITPRHRTLRAAVEYGYLQLPSDLQRLFTRLSVFRGGWDLDAATAICQEAPGQDAFAIIASLTELRERSLIFAEEINVSEDDTQMRYRMLETLREFGGEQLSYADRTLRRQNHAAFYLHLAETSEVSLGGPQQKRFLTNLDRELENLRTALAWTVETGETETGLRLASALGAYWAIRGPLSEGFDWLKQLLDIVQAIPGNARTIPVAVQSKAWRTLGHLAWSQASYSVARAAHSTALALRRAEGNPASIIESLYHLGITAYRQDDYAAARPWLEESLERATAANDAASIARVLLNLGNIAYGEHRLEDGLALLEQSLAIVRELDDRQRVADVMNNMGLIALAMKEYARAEALFEDALVIYRQLTNDNGTAVVLANLGTIIRLQQENERARGYLAEGLKIAAHYGNRFIMIHYFLQLGILDAADGNMQRSVVLMSAAENLSATIDGSRHMDDAEGYQEALQESRSLFGDADFARLWSYGQSLPLSRVVAAALAPPAEFDTHDGATDRK